MAISIWVGPPRSYTPGRNRPPQYVVMHGTAGNEGPNAAENGAAYDKTRTDGTSTHYFTDSSGPALQEVSEGDRAHAALFHGNEIGIQVEVCGLPQTREQWLDPVSYATLVTTAALVRDICQRNGFELRLLSVAETRAAYYAAAGQRPTGITDHARVTQAYPEDGGDHMDMWDGFPWDVFMQLVTGGAPPSTKKTGADVSVMVMRSGEGSTARYWVGNGMYHREVTEDVANRICQTLQYFGAPIQGEHEKYCQVVSIGAAEVGFIHQIVGPVPLPVTPGGSGPSFDTLVEAARQGANQAEDT